LEEHPLGFPSHLAQRLAVFSLRDKEDSCGRRRRRLLLPLPLPQHLQVILRVCVETQEELGEITLVALVNGLFQDLSLVKPR